MPTATITKTFRFEAAHQLPNHNGKCRNLHGHSYQVTVEITGPIQTARGESYDGMVLDFDRLKRAWQGIEPSLDHQFLNDSIGDQLDELLNPDGVVVRTPTTAENIAALLAHYFWTATGVAAATVTVHETQTAGATVTYPFT